MSARWQLGVIGALLAVAPWVLAEGPAAPRAAAIASSEAPAVAELPASVGRSTTVLRSQYLDLLHASADKAKPDLAAVVPDLVAFYNDLSPRDGVPFAEIDRIRNGLEARLEHLRYRLHVEKRRLAADAKREARSTGRARPGVESSPATLAGGGLTAARAQQLIDLITNTIAPESWDINGGKGRIMFYSPLNVLVIRATGEVHEQVGGTLGQLKN